MAAMPYDFRRRAPYNGDQPPAKRRKAAPSDEQPTAPQMPFSVKEEPAPPTTSAATVTEQQPEPEYTTAPKWTDSAGKTRTWVLRDPEGSHVAEITTKRDAEKLAALLNGITGQSR